MNPTNFFKDKRIAITGGTGSFGNQMTQTLIEHPIKSLLIFSRDEEKQLDMKRSLTDPRIEYVIGNVRDFDSIYNAIDGIDHLFHAAALKIITTCENHPIEAIKTNLLGTINVRNACMKRGVKRAIFINTDKAVKPVNTYGMTKALAEKVWISPSNSTHFIVARYGNIIRSRGSVIPFFETLYKETHPFPITHPDMTRFLITLPHAIELVLTAIMKGRHGDIYVPKTPACNILDLVHAIGGEEYPIDIVGIRPGEKINEILIHEEEINRVQEHEKLYVISNHNPHTPLNQEYTSTTTRTLSILEIKELLQEAMPCH